MVLILTLTPVTTTTGRIECWTGTVYFGSGASLIQIPTSRRSIHKIRLVLLLGSLDIESDLNPVPRLPVTHPEGYKLQIQEFPDLRDVKASALL
jgi:hypothetical protein